nr:hypothetical protein [Tanacetum cinerariifolium]
MAGSLSHTDSEVEALVQKLIDEDKGRQNAILDLAMQFKNPCTAKDDLKNAYDKCTDISQESRALIDTFLKEGSDKDYELNLFMYENAAKLEKQMDANLDIDDFDLHLTHVLRSSSSARVEPSSSIPNLVRIIPGPAGTIQLSIGTCFEPSSSTPNPVRIIPGPAGLVQQVRQLKENVFILDSDGALMSTQEYMQKVVEDVDEDDDFNKKLDQVVAIVKSCSPNYLGDLNVTMKDLSGTVRGTVHYKVLDVRSYGNDITVGAAMILANVYVFTSKTSEHYINITKKNVVKVFRKDTV